MAFSVKGTDLTAESIAAQLSAAPDDYDLRLRIDAGLAASNRFAEVVQMWDRKSWPAAETVADRRITADLARTCRRR